MTLCSTASQSGTTGPTSSPSVHPQPGGLTIFYTKSASVSSITDHIPDQ